MLTPSTPDTPASALWSAISLELQQTLAAPTYSAWFSRASARSLTDDVLEVQVPNEFVSGWISGHFMDLVTSAAATVTGLPLTVSLVVEAGTGVSSAPPEPEPVAVPPRDTLRTDTAVPSPARTPRVAPLNRNATFETFVIGPSNRFAHAAALAVAEAPSQAYNPLFIHGSTGLGKTHLLQAIAHYVTTSTPDMTACYVTCEAFTNDFIEALREKRIEQFKNRYRTYDVLLVDDIQFLSGREGIQEEFFHTFNTLHETGSQIVLASDRPPREIARLEDRLRSRFEWGLMTDVQPPDLETRIAILRKKASRDGITIDDPEVLVAVAMRVQTNIRELEGALTRGVAFALLNGEPLTVELVRDVLSSQYPEDSRPVTVESVQRVVADYFSLSIDELRSERRTQTIVFPRQVAMYLSRELTDMSLPQIGRLFGGRDHTTIHYGHDKIAKRIKEDRSLYNLVQELTATIRRLG
ncbi:MAG: chromosomal replication initiator protein DnaA [Thermoleophilia bacterium]|nr:MAG: chromosomal replication initiator protein DnaA [Thermoleophilia bacterium]